MSERCANATKNGVANGKTVYRCKVTCPICHGAGRVDTCKDCEGAGLRQGGFPCNTCSTYGKVPSYTPA